MLDRILDDQRHLYNAALEERIGCYRKTGKGLTYFDQAKSLTECRKEIPEMRECPLAIQRGTLKRLDESYKGFFRRVKAGTVAGFPKFQSRRRFDSISIVSGVKIRDGNLHVPSFGKIPIRRRGGNPYPDGKPLSAVLKRATM